MLKKLFFMCFIILFLSGCNNHDLINNEIVNDDRIDINNEEDTKDIYIDNNPIKVALYSGKNKIIDYSTTLANFKDIGVFSIYYTDADVVDSSVSRVSYPKYYNQYENIDGYKTGFYFSFVAEGKIISHTVLDPSSKHAMTPYLYIYLYDDVNQKPGSYYNHLEMDDVNDKTVFSSIKLFLAQEGVKISSPISMTVFTYDGDEDFDEDGKYRGISSYTVNISVN